MTSVDDNGAPRQNSHRKDTPHMAGPHADRGPVDGRRGVIALRSSGLFPHLATLSPETIGAMLESAALAPAPETAG
ncbi:hypothetical protein [Streptomyces sp. CS227]|uniref:hypothetical protein n=1 Tax=Streptomyces sp. CS227 TaxID=1982763 RepID=UPI00211B5C57|nr:hypothetical protein [Streptomyces sp. CS227]